MCLITGAALGPAEAVGDPWICVDSFPQIGELLNPETEASLRIPGEASLIHSVLFHLHTNTRGTVQSSFRACFTFFKNLFYFLAAQGLYCCAGFSLAVVHRLLIAVASPLALAQALELTGFSSCGARSQ